MFENIYITKVRRSLWYGHIKKLIDWFFFLTFVFLFFFFAAWLGETSS